ncbi:MAG: hypothetical protein EXR61_04855 [Chloroflexi bacterium]|nr:hypothetical protein [Chloroflexota bacterium]
MAWAARGVLLVVLAFANLNDIWSPDVVPNALFSWTILREGNVEYGEFTGPPGSGLLDRESYFFRACGTPGPRPATEIHPPRSIGGPPPPGPTDRVCSVFPPGIALIALPFFAPFVLGGASPTDLGLLLRVGHFVAAIVEAAATLILWSVMRRFVSARWAFGLVLLYTLGTSVRTVASQALWQHAGVHLAYATALWITLVPRRLGEVEALLAGLALGLGSVVRQITALAIPALLREHPRRVVAGVILGLVPLFVYDFAAFGALLEQGYGAKPFELAAVGLMGLLVSPSRGLFVYEPYTLAAVAALVLAWRRPGEVAKRLRWLSVSALATLLLYASYAEWWGGRVFGPRFLDDLAPILFAALAWGIGEGLLASRTRRVLFAVAAGWSLLLFQAAAFVYDQRWDTAPVNVNLVPARLWEWSDPQWLAVLRDVPSGGARAAAAAVLTALVIAALARVERISSRS